MAGGPGGGDTPTIAQSINYLTTPQQLVVESVTGSIARTISSPSPSMWSFVVSMSVRSGTPNFVPILADTNYGGNYTSVYVSTLEDVATETGDIRFRAELFAQGGSDRGIGLNDVNMVVALGTITMGGTKLAQSFTTGTPGYGVGGVDLMLKQLGTISASSITVEIQTNDATGGDHPSGTAVSGTTVTIPVSQLPPTFSWVTANFSGTPNLSAATKYWIVVTPGSGWDGNGALLWRTRIGNKYAGGDAAYAQTAAPWVPYTNYADSLFRIKKGTGGVFAVDIASRYKARWQ